MLYGELFSTFVFHLHVYSLPTLSCYSDLALSLGDAVVVATPTKQLPLADCHHRGFSEYNHCPHIHQTKMIRVREWLCSVDRLKEKWPLRTRWGYRPVWASRNGENSKLIIIIPFYLFNQCWFICSLCIIQGINKPSLKTDISHEPELPF